MPKEPTYIGDGVYVHDNGYNIELTVNHHNNKVITLEKEQMIALLEYCIANNHIKLKGNE